jgi:hypothetical protein
VQAGADAGVQAGAEAGVRQHPQVGVQTGGNLFGFFANLFGWQKKLPKNSAQAGLPRRGHRKVPFSKQTTLH